MAFKLTDGNGMAALAEPIAGLPPSMMFSNATRYTLGATPTLVSSDELFWIAGDAVAVARSMNRSVAPISPLEEAEEGSEAPSARGYEEYAAENLRLSEASLGAAFEVLPPE
jgi:hypothetical protein